MCTLIAHRAIPSLREVSEPEKFIPQQGEEREERYPNGSFATLTGRETIEEAVGGFRYQIGAGDFFQVNPVVAKQLQDAVLKASDEYQGHAIVDLYCGVGLLTLPLAKMAGRLVSKAVREPRCVHTAMLGSIA